MADLATGKVPSPSEVHTSDEKENHQANCVAEDCRLDEEDVRSPKRPRLIPDAGTDDATAIEQPSLADLFDFFADDVDAGPADPTQTSAAVPSAWHTTIPSAFDAPALAPKDKQSQIGEDAVLVPIDDVEPVEASLLSAPPPTTSMTFSFFLTSFVSNAN